MNNILEIIEDAKTIGIAGHVRPDGDCLGSVTSLLGYINNNFPEKKVEVFLEGVPDKFNDLSGADKIITDYPDREPFDLFLCVDCADVERIADAKKYFTAALKTANIDHHFSNTMYAQTNHVVSDASSTCEVLFDLLDYDKITVDIAKSLYTGIIHDTGVFKHSCTSSKTMQTAGMLMDKGLNVASIIDDGFYAKTYTQNQILGRCLLESILVLDGKVIFSALTRKMMDFYGAVTDDIDGIIDQLRVTRGIEVAILVHEIGEQTYKVSMRSNGQVNVSEICGYFGGGGHIKAAGCNISGSIYDVINNLTGHIEKQLKAIENDVVATEENQ